MYYIHTDYLGSWLAITDNAGSLTNKYSYDAWGRPRDPETWELLTISITDALVNLNAMQPRFDRGYTGHELMAGFGLINMKCLPRFIGGRLYDPYLQRVLSPDNFVQMPTNSQNYNRYSYCLNNPFRYTDPSGDCLGWIIAAAIILTKFYLDGKEANNGEANPFKWGNWDKATYTIGISSGGGNTSYSAGVSWNGQTGASIGYANGGIGFGYNPSRPGNLYTPMPGNSNSIDQMVRQQIAISIEGIDLRKNSLYALLLLPSESFIVSLQAFFQNTTSKDNPNSYYMFPNISSAKDFLNRNSQRKELFFYITTNKQVIIGPWNDAVSTAVMWHTSPRWHERFNKDRTNPQVLYGGSYYSVEYFGHTHPYHSNPSVPEDINIADYFSYFNIGTLISYKNNFYIYFPEGGGFPYDPNL